MIAVFMVISDTLWGSIITGIVSVIGLLIVNIKVFKISDKQNVIHKQLDGQQTMLIEASKGQSKAEGRLETKDEVIEILKHTEPLNIDHNNVTEEKK